MRTNGCLHCNNLCDPAEKEYVTYVIVSYLSFPVFRKRFSNDVEMHPLSFWLNKGFIFYKDNTLNRALVQHSLQLCIIFHCFDRKCIQSQHPSKFINCFLSKMQTIIRYLYLHSSIKIFMFTVNIWFIFIQNITLHNLTVHWTEFCDVSPHLHLKRKLN